MSAIPTRLEKGEIQVDHLKEIAASIHRRGDEIEELLKRRGGWPTGEARDPAMREAQTTLALAAVKLLNLAGLGMVRTQRDVDLHLQRAGEILQDLNSVVSALRGHEGLS